jgi:hypothetical protein
MFTADLRTCIAHVNAGSLLAAERSGWRSSTEGLTPDNMQTVNPCTPELDANMLICVLLLHCRSLVPPCQTSAAGQDTKQLQQLHARALQLSFCKVSPGSL